MLKRIVTAAVAAVLALAASAPAVYGQKALVYCPVGIDATGCDRIVTALQTRFTDGVDRGYDGSSGTVDLTKVDLHHYGVLVVPSLADDATKQPYALLRSVASRLHFAITGRVAVYSGAPDQGNSNRSDKDALIQSLATWAANGHSRATGLVGLVAFLDLSEHAADRYSWVRDISLTDVSADAQLTAFSDVQPVSARGTSVMSADGRSVRFTNMASYGLHIGRRAAARTEVGALGGTSGAQSVLVMYSNADGKDGATTGGAGTGQVGSTGASMDVSGAKATLSTGTLGGSTMSTGSTSAPTITTDKPDYLPGDTVTFTGTGFAAGDTVTITVHEDPTWSYPDRQFVSVADGNGGFVNRQMVVATQDLGVMFTATAVAVPSGLVAQTTFTDGNATLSGTVTDASTSLPLAGVTVMCNTSTGCNATITATTDASGKYAFSGGNKLSFSTNGPVNFSLSFSKAGYVTGSLAYTNVNNTDSFTNQNVALTPAGPTKLAFTTASVSGAVNACLGPITVQTQNGSNTPTNVLSSTTINLTTESGTGGAGAFYDTNACSSTITSVTLATGSNSGSFYYKATARGTGSHTLTAAATGLTSANQTETINRADQATLTATAPTTGTYGDHLTMTATGGSGTGALSFTVGAGSTACSIITTQPDSGKLAIIAGTGSCSITATKAQDNDYNSATSAALNVTAGKKTVTVATLAASNKTYNGTNAATLTGGTLAGVLASDESNVGLDITGATATFADANAGIGKTVTATGLGLNGNASGNYVLNPTTASTTANIDQLGLVASITASGKEYDGTTTVTGTVNCTVATRIGTDDVGCSATGAVFGGANAGAETVTANVALTGAAKGNYTLGTQAQASVSATISQKALTITADNQVKTYDGNPFTAFTATYSGLIAADATTGGQPNAGVLTTAVTFGGPAASAVNAGSYSIDPSGATATNYSITFASGTLKIDQATATIHVSGFTGPYDGHSHAGSCSATGVVNDVVPSASTFNPGGSTAPVDAGSYGLTCAVSGQVNYKDGSAQAAILIDKVPLTVTADDKAKTYDGGAYSPFTSTTTGFVNGENSSVVSGSVTFTGSAVGALGAGTYTITPVVSGLSATNYSFTPVNGTLKINQRPASVTPTAAEKAYGNPDPSPLTIGTLSNFVSSDNVSATYTRTPAGDTPSTNNTSPQTYTINATLAPSAVLSNYSITYNTAAFTITNDVPSITSLNGPPAPVPLGSAVTVSGGFSDHGFSTDMYTVSSTWTDGSNTLIVPSVGATGYNGSTGGFSISAPTNAPAGVYTVTVTVTDKWGAASAPATVTGYVVVYDPNGGFVTGGGWIIAPNQSCDPTYAPAGVCTNATGGRANFGFVSKYQKGANVPSGNTEFQFQAGNLNFKSSTYQWLVISGPQAQFKGTGTINGGSTQYSFILTAVDGSVSGGGGTDKFRIKIMDSNGNVIFDNMQGMTDATVPTTALGGGDVTIHSK